MKVLIDCDEYYPFYGLSDLGTVEADIGEKELAWMQSVFAQFNQVQERLRELYEEKK